MNVQGLYDAAVAAGGEGAPVDALFEDAAFNRLVRQVATRMGQRFSVKDEPEDVRQIVLMAAVACCRERASWVAGVGAFEKALYLLSQDMVRSYAQSAAARGVSGASGVFRRQRDVARMARTLFEQTGVQPSVDRVVDAYNAAVVASRKDAVRQGALARVADLSVEVVLLPADWDIQYWDFLPLDASEVAQAVVSRCRSMSPDLGAVAAAWLGSGVASDAEVAAVTGLTVRKVRSQMQQVAEVARKVLADDFGIT